MSEAIVCFYSFYSRAWHWYTYFYFNISWSFPNRVSSEDVDGHTGPGLFLRVLLSFFFFFVFGGNPRPGGLRVPSIKATTSSEMNLFRLVLPEIHFILSFWGLKDKNVTPALVRPPNSKRMFTRDPGLLILSPPNCWRYVCTYSNLLLCTTPHTCTGKGSRL